MTLPSTLAAVAAHGLPGSLLDPPAEPLDDGSWLFLVAAVRRQRLAGLLHRAVLDGAMAVTPRQAEEAAELHVEGLAGCLLLERQLLMVASLLDDVAVEHRVIKGTSVAHLDYPDPALRLFGDLDVLVRPEQFDLALATLLDGGYRRRYPEARPGFDRRFSKSVSLVGPTGLELDLHRTFAFGRFGLSVDLQQTWSALSRFELAGRSLAALGPEQRFLNVCFNAALGDVPPRLVPLRDVAQMALSNRLDPSTVRLMAEHWRAGAVVAHAVSVAWKSFQLSDATPLSAWAQDYRPDPRQERALALFLDPRSSYARRALATLQVVGGVRNKAAFIRGHVFPGRRYVAASRYGANTSRWGAGLRQLMDDAHR